MMNLEFPPEAIRAAREFAKAKNFGVDFDATETIGGVQCTILNEFQHASLIYGVADAVLAGKRMRLLHEIAPGSRLNCAEVGLNIALLHHAIAPGAPIRILRYAPSGYGDHFALLHYDGEPNPQLFDPLFGLSGRINLRASPPVFYPDDYLTRKSHPELHEFSPALSKDDLPRRMAKEYAILTIDDLLRHRNYMNSPLGFFDYFAAGQKLMTDRKGLMHMDFSAIVENNALIVSMTAGDGYGLAYTIQERFSHCEGGVLREERELLHAGFQWVTPTRLLYETDGISEKLHNEGPFAPLMLQYIRSAVKTGGDTVYSEDQRLDVIEGMNSDAQRLRADVARLKKSAGVREYAIKRQVSKVRELVAENPALLDNFERLHALAAENIPSVSLVVIDELDDVEAEVKRIHAEVQYVGSLPNVYQKRRIDMMAYEKSFMSGAIRPTRPYARFAPAENVLPWLRNHLVILKTVVTPHVQTFRASDVYQRLVEQYVDASEVRTAVHTLTQTPDLANTA